MSTVRALLGVFLVSTSVGLVAAGGCSSKKSCPAGQQECLGTCRDLQTDPISCGSCGHVCPTGASCADGACVCPEGATACGNTCVDLQTSARNCGTCGHDCGTGTCSAGACACGANRDCGPAASPQCVDDQADRQNCGACGHDCGAGTCQTGACVCSSGITNCGPTLSPQCRDTTADRANCGACGHACADTQICRSSQCVACSVPTPDRCGNSCTNLQTDGANCGACGSACSGAQVCSAGQCACPSGKTACLGACVDTQTDPANCGACGKKCPTGQACANGACACTTGVTCGGTCCAGGSACCGTSCESQHDTGIPPPSGQGTTFFDCNAPGSAAAALSAAQHFAAGSQVTNQNGLTCSFVTECVAWLTSGTPQSCAVWCYAGAFAGLATVTQSTVCLCPDSTSVAWR